MKVKKKRRICFKSVVSLVLAIMITAYTLIADWSLPSKVSAQGATDRVTTFINLAKGQSIVDADGNTIANLTEDELRFLGVYLSNFYVPFTTELGISADNDSTISQMASALSKNMSWSEDMSKILCDKIIGLTRANDSELVIAKSVGYMEDLKEVPNLSCNYFNFLRLMLGSYSEIYTGYTAKFKEEITGEEFKELSDEEKQEYESFEDNNGTLHIVKYGDPIFSEDDSFVYFCYKDSSGNLVPVCDASIKMGIVTSSQTVFKQILSSMKLNKGYGFSFFDLSEDEVKDADSLLNIDATPEELAELSIYGDKMYVDCFGNIIKKGKIHQYIAIPACMNPYTWVAVDTDGNDWTKPGVAYNMINFASMSLADNSKLLNTSNSSHDSLYSGVLDEYSGMGYPEIRRKAGIGRRDTGDTTILLTIINYDDWDAENDNGKVKYNYKYFGLAEMKKGRDSYTSSGKKGDKKCNSIHYSTVPYFTDKGFEGIFHQTEKVSGHLWWKEESSKNGMSLCILRGTSNYKLTTKDSENVGKGEVQENYEELAQCVIKAETGFRSLYPNDCSYYLSKEHGFNSDIKLTRKATVDQLAERDAVFIFSQKDNALYYSTPLTSSHIFNRVYVMDGMVSIDNLGVFNTDNGGSADLSTINIINYLDNNGKTPNKLLESYSKDANNGYGSTFSDYTSGKMNTDINVSEAAVTSIYTTYLIAGLYENNSDSKKATIGKLGFRLNIEGLPSIESTAITLPEEYEISMQEDAIRDWVYYLLNPTKGLDYVRVLIKNKTQAVLVGWHNDMVGTNGVGATTGTTTYKSNIGFVTTPDLTELKWTNGLLSSYEKAIPYIILAILILMIFTYIAGILSLQRAFTSVVLFGVLLFVPIFAINKVVTVSNSIIQKIYGDRFIYWAVVQQESYATALDEAATSDSYENYLRSLYALNSETYSNQGGDSIVLKWQAPKKMASLVLTKNDSDLTSNLQDSKLVSWALNRNTMSGQTYTDGESSYLFRSYTDLSNVSRYMYNGFDKGNVEYNKTEIGGDKNFKAVVDSYKTKYKDAISLGYNNTNKNSNTDLSNCLRITAPISSKMYYDATTKSVNGINKLDSNSALGINQNAFNFSISVFNNKTLTFRDVLYENKVNNDSELGRYITNYGSEDSSTMKKFETHMASLAAYGVMSESPYYYFSWNLYDQGMSTSAGAQGGYKNLLLNSKDNFNYFYNNQGNGEMKDFMDMKSLFTVLIPYLKQGNDLVREFDEAYGLFLYDGVPTEEGHWEDQGMKDSNGNATELYKKYWHNVTVARLYEIYTPWVDLMYDCDYAQETTVKALGKEYRIVDPLNPGCYPIERPMIFSRSEMADYGLTESDLTEVERRIIETNDDMCKRMFELLNYVNFRDSTLNSAAAMECTFAFNIAFSDDGIFGDNINIYPQSFEINNFSYDAFLRFVLSNTTGEDMTGSSDFYLTVVQKSSTTTAIMLIINDIVSQYIFPGFKIFFLVAVFIAIIMMIVVTVGKMNPEQNSIKKLMINIVLPLLGFLVANIVFAWVLSLFMGTGNNAVTQTDVSIIQTGDPVIAMLIMVALDVICMIAYFFMIRNVIKEIQSDYHLIKGFVGGVVQGVGGKISSLGGNGSSSSSEGAGNGSVAEEGTGQMSDRAVQRGNSKAYENREEGKSKRINEAKRDLFKQNKDTSDKKRSEKEINDKIKEGSKHFENDSDSSSSADVDMKDTPDTIQEYNNLDNVDSGMDNMESGMDNMESGMDNMEQAMDNMDQAMDNMDDAVDQVGNNPEM